MKKAKSLLRGEGEDEGEGVWGKHVDSIEDEGALNLMYMWFSIGLSLEERYSS